MKKWLLVQVALFCAFVTGCKPAEQTGTIGVIFPASGGVAHYGIQSRDGIILAAEEINAAGGLLGKKIKLVIEDDEGDSAKTVNIFTKLTTRDKISLILGSSTSGPTMAISELAQRQKVIVFSPSATNIDVTRAGDYVFRACFIDPFQGIKRINRSGTTILLVEQNAYKALSIAARAYILETGAVVSSGPAVELMNDDSVKAAYLGG